jgi:hypothetical protein
MPPAETVDAAPGVPPMPPAETVDAAPGVPPMPPAETVNAAPGEPIVSEAVHVSEDPELVEEVAEPGAEDGAGAAVRIREPWPGYRLMKAAEIVDRLASASAEELAAVELYELAGRGRTSVVAAARRALKQASPPR